jgi:hypothetical protein
MSMTLPQIILYNTPTSHTFTTVTSKNDPNLFQTRVHYTYYFHAGLTEITTGQYLKFSVVLNYLGKESELLFSGYALQTWAH